MDERGAGGGLGRGRRSSYALGLLSLAAVAVTACGSSSRTAGPAPAAAAAASPASGAVTGSGATGSATAAPGGGTPAAVESNPPGDIPDTVAYVPYTGLAGVSFTHPEGWAQSAVPGGIRFTDKLNGVTVTLAAGAVPTVAQVRSQVVPTLGGTGRATDVSSVDAATLPAGRGVRVVWRVNSAPDPVTGRIYRDEVVTYLVGDGRRVARLDLSGAVGSDNVDPYRTMSQSLKLS